MSNSRFLFLFLCCLIIKQDSWGQPVPPPATQTEVNTGVNRYKYVTPFTLQNWSGISSATGAITVAQLNYISNQVQVVSNGVILNNVGYGTNLNVRGLSLSNIAADTVLAMNAQKTITNLINASATNVNAFFSNVTYLSPIDAGKFKTVVEAATAGTLFRLGPGKYYIPSNNIAVPQGVSIMGAGRDVTTIMCPLSQDVGPQFTLDANTIFYDMTLDLTNRLRTNAYQVAFGGVVGTASDSTNIILRNLNIYGASDCILLAHGSPKQQYKWRLENCYLESGFDLLSIQTSDTNVWVDCFNTIFYASDDSTRHWVNPSTSVIGLDQGTVNLFNCRVIAYHMTNMYLINNLSSSSYGNVVAHGTSFETYPRVANGGDNYHVKLTSNHQLFVDSGSTFDFEKVLVSSGTGQVINNNKYIQTDYLRIGNTADPTFGQRLDQGGAGTPGGSLVWAQNQTSIGTAPFWKVGTQTNNNPNGIFDNAGFGSFYIPTNYQNSYSNVIGWVKQYDDGVGGGWAAIPTSNYVHALVVNSDHNALTNSDTRTIIFNGTTLSILNNFVLSGTTNKFLGGSGWLFASNSLWDFQGIIAPASTNLIDTLTSKGSPGTGDYVMIEDIATGLLKKATLTSLPSSGSANVTVKSNGTTIVTGTTLNLIEGTNVVFRGTNNSGVVDVQINAVAGTGTGTPGGSTAMVQFNTNNTFAGDNSLTYDAVNQILKITNGASPGTTHTILKIIASNDTNVFSSLGFEHTGLNGTHITHSDPNGPSWTLTLLSNSISPATVGMSNAVTLGSTNWPWSSVYAKAYIPITLPTAVDSSTNHVVDGSLGSYFTNAVSNGTTPTNAWLVFTNIADKQTVIVDLIVSNGITFSVGSAPGTAFPASWYFGGIATSINTNGLTRVSVTRVGGWTNVSIQTVDLQLAVASSGANGFLALLTNYVGATVAVSNTYIPQVSSIALSNWANYTTNVWNSRQGGAVGLSNVTTQANFDAPTISSNWSGFLNTTYTNYPAITVSNFTFTFATNSYELVCATNLVLTNITPWRSVSGNLSIVVRPANGANVTVTYPAAGVNLATYNWRTNANNTLWTTLTNNKVYVVSIAAISTNLFPTITLWE